MKISIENARQLGTRVLTAQDVPGDIAADVAEHLVESDRCGYPSPPWRGARRAGWSRHPQHPRFSSGAVTTPALRATPPRRGI